MSFVVAHFVHFDKVRLINIRSLTDLSENWNKTCRQEVRRG
jgi:hypothetical protein